MLYFLNERAVSRWEFDSSLDAAAEWEAESNLKQFLDSTYRDVCIEEFTIYPSEILKACRPIDYERMIEERFNKISYNAYINTRLGKTVRLGGNVYYCTGGDKI